MSCSGGPFSCPETRAAATARLHSLLTAFALYDPTIGYCQGLHDCAAPFLEVFDEDWKVRNVKGRQEREHLAASSFWTINENTLFLSRTLLYGHYLISDHQKCRNS